MVSEKRGWEQSFNIDALSLNLQNVTTASLMIHTFSSPLKSFHTEDSER